MKKEELLGYCKLYKGEAKNPYEGNDMESSMIWNYENFWVSKTIDQKENNVSFLDNLVDEYINDGLRSFEQYDGTPLSLKAVLYNRYVEWNESDAEHFKNWYKRSYKKEGV